MSRSGAVRQGEQETGRLENVTYVAGDCLKKDTFSDHLADVDAVVHCVGGLFESNKPGRSLQALNRDSCINMASELQRYAAETGQ